MTARDWYGGRIREWSARHETGLAKAASMSRWRLLTFLGGALVLVFGLKGGSGALMAVGAAGFIAFGWLVVRHARVLEGIARAEAALTLNRHAVARLDRDWDGLPEIPRPSTLDWDTHPYARDLDIYGHASLTKWLGAPATSYGTRRLTEWLLEPADADDLPARQAAVDELATRREWREALAIEGRLAVVTTEEFARFLEWAEADAPALPRALKLLALVSPAIAWILIGMWVVDAAQRLPPLTPATLGPWIADGLANGSWPLPVLLNVALSVAFAKRISAVFDRATLGQRVLERYAAMLRLVCDETWHAPQLLNLQGKMRANGSAPALVRELARLGGWSELRTGAALLHIVIQALTLSDFHVLFALERWRSRAGRSVRNWFEGLGSIDALATLSVVRAEYPEWVMPVVGAGETALLAGGLAHPLIADDRRVANDVHVGPAGTLLLVTGSNMSGKSTLLRAIGLNAVLAQAGAPVCATSFHMPPADVYTSIRIEDSLEHGVSYFMAALARLKQIVDAAQRGPGPGRTLMYLLDEVLQGTNSVERALAVRAVARHLLDAGAIGAMTTHDLALASEEPLKTAATLVHFTEQVHPDGTMTFDYRLRPGVATSSNALRLMQLIGIAPR
jgi:hypothetical protein